MSTADQQSAHPHYREVLDAVPEFRCGDELLTRVFRHRWESFAHHALRGPSGWVVTEFRQPGPGRAHGSVNAAAGHHILEGRWLRRTDVVDDYLRFWYTAGEAEPHRYTEWIAWAAREHARLHRGWAGVADLLPGMVDNFAAWEGTASTLPGCTGRTTWPTRWSFRSAATASARRSTRTSSATRTR
ncbi:MGH1-like glycoside hydrolase domain-containing protein [Phytohabitans houttuyneae]|uniref:Mannosylglycerate hydrolase MGH1-like glycoside hydrolase domain-containing protein n=1 Tax=Phytohabitans houttuyneae TaxID=1076126 RepID=A0A6V8KCN7_9ACTN|nr:hypothetical protein Phou_054000 [Phytohabitans houttuyneae]